MEVHSKEQLQKPCLWTEVAQSKLFIADFSYIDYLSLLLLLLLLLLLIFYFIITIIVDEELLIYV